jgi:hypothetical protein
MDPKDKVNLVDFSKTLRIITGEKYKGFLG